jgi:hypothetical protein
MLAHHKPGRTDYQLDEVAGRFAARSPRVTVGAEGGDSIYEPTLAHAAGGGMPGWARALTVVGAVRRSPPFPDPSRRVLGGAPAGRRRPFFRAIDLPTLGG